MFTSILLLLIGLFLIFIEFYLPGGIVGILGGICIVIAIALFASNSSSILFTFLFILVALTSVGLLIRFTLWRIANTKSESGIYSNKDQEGYQASEYDKNAVGKKGIVFSDLKPGGYIMIEGKQHQAISISGYIPKGEEVEVVSGQEESLVVKLIRKEKNE